MTIKTGDRPIPNYTHELPPESEFLNEFDKLVQSNLDKRIPNPDNRERGHVLYSIGDAVEELCRKYGDGQVIPALIKGGKIKSISDTNPFAWGYLD